MSRVTIRPTTPVATTAAGPVTVDTRQTQVLLGVIEKNQGALPHARLRIEPE